jgi:hypothetical protein
MTLLLIRDTPRNSFALIVNGERVAEFPTAAAAWQFAEDAFSVAQCQPVRNASVKHIAGSKAGSGEKSDDNDDESRTI